MKFWELTPTDLFIVEPGLQKYRYTDQKYMHQVVIPIFEVSVTDGVTILGLSEKGLANVSFIPSSGMSHLFASTIF